MPPKRKEAPSSFPSFLEKKSKQTREEEQHVLYETLDFVLDQCLVSMTASHFWDAENKKRFLVGYAAQDLVKRMEKQPHLLLILGYANPKASEVSELAEAVEKTDPLELTRQMTLGDLKIHSEMQKRYWNKLADPPREERLVSLKNMRDAVEAWYTQHEVDSLKDSEMESILIDAWNRGSFSKKQD